MERILFFEDNNFISQVFQVLPFNIVSFYYLCAEYRKRLLNAWAVFVNLFLRVEERILMWKGAWNFYLVNEPCARYDR